MNLTDLNTQQLKAVKTVKHPVLVFAGAGSGKTRVLTYKIWHLIKDKIYKPNEILALTFTNKAAAEMKERIKDSINCDGVNVGTFHSIGARILRMHISYLDDKYNSDFTIYDVADQKALLKEVVEQLNETGVTFYLNEPLCIYLLPQNNTLNEDKHTLIFYSEFSGKEKPGFKYFWKIRKDVFTEEFQRFVENIIQSRSESNISEPQEDTASNNIMNENDFRDLLNRELSDSRNCAPENILASAIKVIKRIK